MFSVLVSDKYPADYDIIFLGFPNWWYDMLMPVYSFLDAYDLPEKAIIPFGTCGASGFSNTISEIQALEPDATVITDGFTVSHSNIKEITLEEVEAWVQGLQIPLR